MQPFMVAVLSAAGLATIGTVPAQAQPTVLQFSPGVPLLHRLVGNDSFVVEREWDGWHAPARTELPPLDAVVGAMGTEGTSAIVRLESVEPRLDDTGAWLQTEIIARVVEPLRKDAKGLIKGRLISISYALGGEATIKGVRVRAGWPPGLTAGSDCLVFLVRDDAEPWRPTYHLMTITRGVLVDTAERQRATHVRNPLDGLRVRDAKRLVRDADVALSRIR